MKKRLSILLIVLSIGLGIGLKNETAFAATINYSVKANIPENQINKNLTYFDLRINPGSQQTISLTVQNTSTEEIELMLKHILRLSFLKEYEF